MKLTRTKSKVDVYGEVVELTIPSLKLWEQYQDVIRKGEVTEFKATEDFLFQCGMPRKLYKSLELEHVSDLVNHLSGIKKK
jgi:hypothetical protein